MGPRVPERETDVIRLHAGKLPYVSLTADIFFRIMAAELAAQRGMYSNAGATMVTLARDTGDPRLARRGLEFYLGGGNLNGALEAARAWASISPHDLEATSTELALAAANGQTKGLAQALRTRIDQAKDKRAAVGQALAVVARLTDRRLALRIFDEALSPAARKLPETRLALSDAAQAAGDYPRAVNEARLSLAADPNQAEAAQRLLEYGMKVDPARALADTRGFIARHPQSRKLRLMLVAQLSGGGDDAAALAELIDMSRHAPEDFDLLYLQGQLYYKSGQLNEARTVLNQYLDVQNQRGQATARGATDAGAAAADAHVLLSRIDEDEGRIDAAVAELGRIDDPSLRYSAVLRQAVLRARQGRVDEALRMIDSASAQDEDEQTMGLLGKAQILRDAGRLDQAITELIAADKALPDTIEIKYELAMLLERQGRIDEMEKLLRQVIELDPDHAHAYNALGYTLADRDQRLPEAQQLVAHALELAPNDPYILDSMGWVKFRMGDSAGAIAYLRRAFAQRPEPEIAAHLSEALWAGGQRDEAQKLLREWLRKASGNVVLRTTAERLGVRP